MKGRALIALAWSAATASTTAYADRIAVEAYVGNRPADAERVLAPIRPILERHRFVVSADALTKRFESHVWRSGGVKTTGLAMYKKIEKGIREFEDARLSAASTLKAGIDLARANPVAWANEPKYRDQVLRGLLFYALALNLSAKGSRDQASRAKGKRAAEYAERASAEEQSRDAAMDDLLLNFPTLVITADEFGAQAEALYLDANKRLRHNGVGSIELDVDDPNVIVYVDETQQPRKTTIGNVGAGRHRVLVVSAAESREYLIDVVVNRRSSVIVRWNLDSVLELGAWVGFGYASENERRREQDLLAALVGPLGGVSIAATLTVKADASAVSGQSYDMRSGKPLAPCTLAVSRSKDPDATEQFARCLAGEKDDRRFAAGGIATATSRPPSTSVLSASPTSALPSADASTSDEDNGPDEDSDDMAEPRTSSRRWMLWTAVGAFGATAVSGGLAVKFVLDGRSAGDEYDRVCAVMCTSQQAKAIIADQNTANRRAWIAASASGVTVVGGVVMLVLWRRGKASVPTPTAQIGHGGASVAWSVEF